MHQGKKTVKAVTFIMSEDYTEHCKPSRPDKGKWFFYYYIIYIQILKLELFIFLCEDRVKLAHWDYDHTVKEFKGQFNFSNC